MNFFFVAKLGKNIIARGKRICVKARANEVMKVMKFFLEGGQGQVVKKILGGGKDQILKCFACPAEELKVGIGNGGSVKSFKKEER